MKHKLPSLDALKVFEAAARHLSFSRAADELYLTKGAVSYQIRRLEEALDCALFRRAVRQVYLTDAGQQLSQHLQPMFAELERSLDRILPEEAANEVVVGVTTYVALRWLSPRLAAFGQRFPEVAIRLQHSVNDDSFRLQDVDFAIRWCEMWPAPARGRPLQLPMPLFPVCSPGFLDSLGADYTGRELAAEELTRAPLDGIPLLCEDRPLDLWQTWYPDESPLPNTRRVVADANVRTQAAIDGQGWTLADALMQRELDNGELVAPFAHRLTGYGYALLTSPSRYVNRSAIELRDWLVEQL